MSHEHTLNVLRELGDHVDGSSYPERVALLALHDAGEPVQMGHLAERIGMSRGALTSIADRLEDAGYIQRAHGKVDRRIVTLAMSKNGMSAVKAATKAAT